MRASCKFATGTTGKHSIIQKQKTSHHHERKSTHKEKHNSRWQHFYWQGINRLQHSNATFFLTEFEHIYTHWFTEDNLQNQALQSYTMIMSPPSTITLTQSSTIFLSPVPNTSASNVFPCQTQLLPCSSPFLTQQVSFLSFHSTVNTFFKLFIANKPVNITCTETIQRKKSHKFSQDGQYITNPRKLSEVINFQYMNL